MPRPPRTACPTMTPVLPQGGWHGLLGGRQAEVHAHVGTGHVGNAGKSLPDPVVCIPTPPAGPWARGARGWLSRPPPPPESGRVILPPGALHPAGGKAEPPSHGLLLFLSVLFLIETTRTPAGPQLQCQWSLEREQGTQGPRRSRSLSPVTQATHPAISFTKARP